MTLDEARDALNLSADADEADVERHYRARHDALRVQAEAAVDRAHREVAERALRDISLARQLLKQWLQSLIVAGPTHTCPACGKAAPRDDVYCRVCGAALRSGVDATSLPALLQRELRLRGYDVRRKISRSDRSELWEGVDHIGHRIVVRFLQPMLSADPRRRQEFIDEAMTQARLVHEHIVPVQDVDAAAEPPWYMQPFIRGVSLHEMIRERQLLEYRTAAAVIATVGRTLQFAHDQGVVHGRLAPRHILLQRLGKPIVNGFGSCLWRGHVEAAAPSIRMVGRQLYVHPRHFLSEGNLQRDPVDDLFALGWILFEVLASEPPFRADDILSHVRIDLEPGLARLRERRPDVPGGFAEVIQRAMSWEPDVRYATASALAEALSDLT